MINKKQLLLLSILLFTISTLATCNQSSQADGSDEYGFPFRFYTFNYSREITEIEKSGFDPFGLILNILIVIISSFFLVKLKDVLLKKKA